MQKARERHCLHFNQGMDFISSNRNKCVWVKQIFSLSWIFSDLGKWSLGVCLSGHAADTMNSHLGWDAPNSIPRLQLELSFRDIEKTLMLLPFFSLLFFSPFPPVFSHSDHYKMPIPTPCFPRRSTSLSCEYEPTALQFCPVVQNKIRTSFYQPLQGRYLWDFSEWAIT